MIALGLTALNLLIHVYIVILECFWWSRATRVFGIPKDRRDDPMLRRMLQNQGAYNGVLVTGLGWGLLHPDPAFGLQLRLFFLGGVAIMGIVGAITADKRILAVQTLPAALALAAHVLT